MIQKRTILFVGAGGAVAEKIIPLLADKYDIVGIGGKRDALKSYCKKFYSGDLFVDYEKIFEQAFLHNTFDAIVWNPVRYYPGPLLSSTRQRLHAEFDLGIALPLECLKIARAHSFGQNATFIFITSGLAFSTKPNWGSYSIVKRGQVIMADYLVEELSSRGIFPKAIALGTVPALNAQNMYEAFVHAIENSDPTKTLYRVYKTPWE